MTSQAVVSQSPLNQTLQILMRSQTQVERSNQQVLDLRRDTGTQLERLMETMRVTLLAKMEENETLAKALLVAETQFKELRIVHKRERSLLRKQIAELAKPLLESIKRNIWDRVAIHQPSVKQFYAALKGFELSSTEKDKFLKIGDEMETNWNQLTLGLKEHSFSQMFEHAKRHMGLVCSTGSLLNDLVGRESLRFPLNAEGYEGMRVRANRFYEETRMLSRKAISLEGSR